MRKTLAPLLLAASLLASYPTSAAILWFGGEDTSVTAIATTSANASGISGRTAFARSNLAVANGTSTTDPPANRWQSPTFAVCTTACWIHGQFTTGTATTSTANEQGLLVRSPDGVSRIVVRQTSTTGQLKVSTRNAAGTLTDLATASGNYTLATTTQFDLFINYTCSGAGQVQLYLATTQVINFTGNPCTDAATSLNQVEFMSFNNGTGTVCSSGGPTCWQELIVASEDTRSMALVTLDPESSGNTQAWTPNTLANVDKALISDTSFVSDPTGNLLSQWKTQTAAPTGTWGVKAVGVEVRASRSLTGPQNLDFSLRVSGSDYLAGTTTAITGALVNYRYQYDVSPATSTTWGSAEVFNTSANQLNIGVKSLP